jgi:multidrug efflux pump
VDYEIVYDPTIFVRGSIEAVVHTLLEAIVLVVLVVILFLQTWRASIIPLAAVPVSLIGTFAVMHMLGFSLNALSLFGLVLAIGIVVDDAVVVVENVERNIGLTGQFYQQFALTIAISTVISAFNSLTLSPALAAALLRSHDAPKDGFSRLLDKLFGAWLFAPFNRVFERASHGYVGAVKRILRGSSIALVVYVGLVGLGYLGFASTPTGFVPPQDKQYLVAFAQLPDAATLDRTEDVIKRMSQIANRSRASRCRKHRGLSGPVDQWLHQQPEQRHRLHPTQALR